MKTVRLEIAGVGPVDVRIPDDAQADDVTVTVQLRTGEVFAYVKSSNGDDCGYRILASGALEIVRRGGKVLVTFGPSAWKSVVGLRAH